MARDKTHLIDRIEDRQKEYAPEGEKVPFKVAVCGEAKPRDWGGALYYPAAHADITMISCPKCATIMAERKLAEAGDHGLTLEKYNPPKGYRSGVYRSEYTILQHGEAVGVVVYAGGWRGGNWVVCGLMVRSADIETVEMSHEMEKHTPRNPTERDPTPYYGRKPKLASKEAALTFALDLLAEGRLKPASEVIQYAKDFRARLERGHQRMAEEAAEEERITDETVAGLREIIAGAEDGSIVLTNFQKSAVENALLLKYKKATRAKEVACG